MGCGSGANTGDIFAAVILASLVLALELGDLDLAGESGERRFVKPSTASSRLDLLEAVLVIVAN